MAMNPHRPNTIVVDFSVLPVRPDAAKVHKFLLEAVKLQLSDVKQIQFHNVRKCVYIEMTSIEVACQYEEQHNLKHAFPCGDKKFPIRINVDCEYTAVRVHDLPPSVDNATIHNYMQQFGTICSISKERWKHYFPGVCNGVRVVHMRLQKPIPSFITINKFESLCTYNGQRLTCRVCCNAAHPGQKCSVPVSASNSNTKPTLPAAANTSSTETSSHHTSSQNSTTDTFSEIVARGRRSLDEESAKKQNENNNYDSADDNSSTSSTTTIDETNGSSKRRLSTQKANEKKKVCQEQWSPNAVPPVDNLDVLNNKNRKGNL